MALLLLDLHTGSLNVAISSDSAELHSSVSTVKQHLEQNGSINQDLDGSTQPELNWALVCYEVGGLEDVASRPQQHHLHTTQEKHKKTQRSTVFPRLSQVIF